MKKVIINALLVLIMSILFITGCKKDTVNIGPTLAFVIDTGYISCDTAMAAGDTALIGLICTWNGKHPILTINTLYNKNKIGVPYQVNSNLGDSLVFKTKILKNQKLYEQWDFEVIDSKGHISNLGLILTVDSGGQINSFSREIGVQGNPYYGSYFDLDNALDYNETDAFANQDSIDIIAGYEYDQKCFIGSPGSLDLYGIYDLSGWGVRHLTQFCATTFSSGQFDLINMDNLLISSFHEENAIDLIINLNINDIYSFRTHNGKYGLMRISSPATGDAGLISIDYIIQQ